MENSPRFQRQVLPDNNAFLLGPNNPWLELQLYSQVDLSECRWSGHDSASHISGPRVFSYAILNANLL